MKISDIEVGMKLRGKYSNEYSPFHIVTVTEITERGFKYSIEKEFPFIAREGSYFKKDGHECFAIDGEVSYDLIDAVIGQ